MNKKTAVIGGGFSGLSCACYLAKAGFDVTLIEKNRELGGRARVLNGDGFTFDMGPSWYWMPEVFEDFFRDFGKKVSDYYELVRLDPGYKVFFSEEEHYLVPASWDKLKQLFESLEPGAGQKLEQFMKGAGYKYKVGINRLVHKPGRSFLEFADLDLAKGLFKLQVFSSMTHHIKSYFKHPRLIQLLEFPVLFLGAKPENTPALYSLMNYADLKLGTWYPMGGMFRIVEGMENLAKELGVKVLKGTEVSGFEFEGTSIKKIITEQGSLETDLVVGGADYHHIDQELLPKEFQSYSPSYWDSRVLAPSALLFYLGIRGKVNGLEHHSLCFDAPFGKHAASIYDHPEWPNDPLFYVSCPSKTDPSVAPEGDEALILLVPLAPGLEDVPEKREALYVEILKRLEKLTGESILDRVVYKRSYAHKEFVEDYHSFKGNAYGLANTLLQTGPLKPSIRSKKVRNLYFTGQLTVPGPGVPPSLISGKVASGQVDIHFKKAS